jgi:hypothetical protein
MASARFLRLVRHLHSYGGAVAARVEVFAPKEGVPPMATVPAPMPEPALPSGAREIRATAAELKLSDIGDVFSVGDARG